MDYDTGYTESHYYKITDGKSYSEREIISEAKFDEFMEANPVFIDWEKHTEFIDKSGITFIPMLD